tara:strand:- start:795 stop:1187 length:393 start_codon:yes stop_codon:yes gene_type:complete
LALATLAIALFAGLGVGPAAQSKLVTVIANDSIRWLLGFGLGFLGGLCLGALFQWIMSKLIVGAGLSGFDRTLGLFFGACRGILVCVLFLIVVRPYADQTLWWDRSKFEPILSTLEEDFKYAANWVRNLF